MSDITRGITYTDSGGIPTASDAHALVDNAVINKEFITDKSLVSAESTDYVLVSDTSDSGALKKALFPTFSVGSATEGSAGIAELATQSETNAGTDDSRIVTPLKLVTHLVAQKATTIDASTTGSGLSLRNNAGSTLVAIGAGSTDANVVNISGVLQYNGVELRERLSANRTYYVRTDGNDSNNGLANTSGGAFLTIQKAINVALYEVDFNSFDVTIQCNDATRTTAISVPCRHHGGGNLILIGNTSTPANCVLSVTNNSCVTVEDCAELDIRGFRIATTTSGNGLYAIRQGLIRFSNMEFGAVADNQIIADDAGIVLTDTNYSIVGAASAHWLALRNGLIRCDSKTITITGTPAFAFAFAASRRLGCINCDGNTYSGSATGKRYDISVNGVIYANGATLPGNASGTAVSGGQYV